MNAAERDADADGTEPFCCCKIGAVSERYALPSLSHDLEVLWTAEGDDRHSLRELAEYFNQRLLEAAMRETGVAPLEGEVDNRYRLLVADEVSPGDRVEVESVLEYEGVRVEQLRSDFVSHQTVYRHLKNCLDAEYERDTDSDSRLRRDVERIGGFQHRIGVIVDEMVRRLQGEPLAIERPRTYVDIRLTCEECGVQLSPRELLDRRECDCLSADDRGR